MSHGERVNAAGNPDTPAATLEALARDGDWHVRHYVAGNANAPAAVLEKLAKDEVESVRLEVAGNANTPPVTLGELAKDGGGEKYVPLLAADNLHAPDDALKLLKKDHPDAAVRKCAERTLQGKRVLRHEKTAVPTRLRLARDFNTRPEVLAALAKDEDIFVRAAVAKNQNASAETLAELAKDENINARKAAEGNPAKGDLDIREESDWNRILTGLNVEAMTKKKKGQEQAVQEAPAKSVETPAGVKPEKGKETEAKDGERPTQERKPREPQMVTVNGQKVTHGHAFQGSANPENWYFAVKVDGTALKPARMALEDVEAYRKKETGVPELMGKYHPTKLMPKVSPEAYRMPRTMAGPEGDMTVSKFSVFKEKDEQRPDFGRYKIYAEVDGKRMFAPASREDLDAFFDRVTTPEKLVEKNFGERLHMKSAFEKYVLPEGG